MTSHPSDAEGPRRRPKDDVVWRRRRKTAPADHLDYQEAVSSLLWEPYECRDPPRALSLYQEAHKTSILQQNADSSLLWEPYECREPSTSSILLQNAQSASSFHPNSDRPLVWEPLRPSTLVQEPCRMSILLQDAQSTSSCHQHTVSSRLTPSASFPDRPPSALSVAVQSHHRAVASSSQSRSGRCRGNMSACPAARVSVNQCSQVAVLACDPSGGATQVAVSPVKDHSGVVTQVAVCSANDRSGAKTQVAVSSSKDHSGGATQIAVSPSGGTTQVAVSSSKDHSGVVTQMAVCPSGSMTQVVVCPVNDHSGGVQECSGPVGAAVSCAVSSTNLALPSSAHVLPSITPAVTVNASTPPSQEVQLAVSDAARDARRRERRERRHQRRVNSSQNQLNAASATSVWTTRVEATPGLDQRLPDLLSAHLPPAYSTLPTPATPATPPATVAPTDGRFPFQAAPANRRRLRRPDRRPKSCCGLEVTQTVSIRWFVVVIAFVGVCCAVVGTTLGAMEASGRDHLTVSLLMIGVGIVLVTVSGVAWRLTANEAPSCRAMLGLDRRGDGEVGVAEPNRRFVPRLPPSFGRPHHPYAAMLYPEFAYRPPPPSYAASMQEYRLRLLLDRHSPLSPPPQYRTGAGSGGGSRPPSYRGRTAPGQSGVSVISVPGEAAVPDPLKLSPETELPSEPLVANDDKEGNLVTIVSTGDVDAVVTVTTCSETVTTSELDILAHL